MGPRILVVDDEAGLREMLRVLLTRAGFDVKACSGVQEALRTIAASAPFEAVVTDLLMPDGSGMEVLDAARREDANTQVLMITAQATTAQAVEAMRKGAYDYIQKPFKNHQLLATLEKALEKRAIVDENRALREEVESRWTGGNLVGKSAGMDKVRDLVSRVAASASSVLITGESGTGKEVVARSLHQQSGRSGQFVVINCGALPESLMESELFGHKKGAFTGATDRKDGLFRAAEGGTLFLDEIGELPLTLQPKLLRALQERRVRPVGSEEEVPVDVRVLAATNRKVDDLVESGEFRQDLFYRLNVIRVHLPPLRDRPKDIPLLAQHLLRKHAALAGRRLSLSPDALRWLTGQPFDGNVRELENAIERAVILARGSQIEREDFPQESVAPLPWQPDVSTELSEGFDLDTHLAVEERRLLDQALEQSGGNRTRAAKLLGMSFRSFRYRLAKYEDEPESDV